MAKQPGKVARLWRHFVMTRGRLRRVFSTQTVQAIETAVQRAESTHGGELRFVVEAELGTADLLRDVSPRQRALQLFAQLGMWDTADNNGVLIYVLLADRDVEIVADRGYKDRVTDEEWARACATIESAYREGDYERGSVHGIEAASRLMARCYPTPDRNELSDSTVLV